MYFAVQELFFTIMFYFNLNHAAVVKTQLIVVITVVAETVHVPKILTFELRKTVHSVITPLYAEMPDWHL